jgi:hypothetical protein
MKYVIIICLSSLFIPSCKPKGAEVTVTESQDTTAVNVQTNEFQAYEDEIMKIHDDVMPKVSDINRLSRQLREIKTKTGTTDATKPSTIVGLDETLKSLEDAEQEMMNWMKYYSETKPRLTPDLEKIFYERELEKITNVKMTMLNSIEKANTWLNAHPELK